MEYENIKSEIIDNDEMYVEFSKCRTKLETAIKEYAKDLTIIDTKGEYNLISIIEDETENEKHILFDSIGYLYETKCHSIDDVDDLVIKQYKFQIKKYLKSNKNKYENYTISNVDICESNILVSLVNKSKSKKLIYNFDDNMFYDVKCVTENKLEEYCNESVVEYKEQDYDNYLSRFKKRKKESDEVNKERYDEYVSNYTCDVPIVDIFTITVNNKEYIYVTDILEYEFENTYFLDTLVYFEVGNYIYVKNKEYSTFLNQNKFISEKLASMYLKLANKTTSMGNFYRNDNANKNNLVSNAVYKMMRKGFKFNPKNSNKIFCYFTYIITREFAETSKKQYKLTNENEVSLDSMLGGGSSDND